MEHRMRRFKQQLPADEARQIMHDATGAVLSLPGDDGYPYGVPLSFVYDEDSASVYFHSATKGHKIDCIGQGCKCSLCIIAQDNIVPEKFTTYFKSVICFGTIVPVTDPDEIIKGLKLLGNKYSPGIDSDAEINGSLSRITVLRMDIDRMTGKESIELTAARRHPGS